MSRKSSKTPPPHPLPESQPKASGFGFTIGGLNNPSFKLNTDGTSYMSNEMKQYLDRPFPKEEEKDEAVGRPVLPGSVILPSDIPHITGELPEGAIGIATTGEVLYRDGTSSRPEYRK